jgi:anti-sigma B factor antagonist
VAGKLNVLQTEFRIAVRNEGRGTVLQLFGELDVASSPALEAELARVSDVELLVIDLRALDFIDSTGLSVLVRRHQHAEEHGQEFALVKGAGQVERLLGLTGLSEQLPVAETPEELLGGV